MTDFKGNLGNYKIIKTEDNTQTIWSEYFDEACHNLSGAYEETLHNYIRGCEIPELFSLNNQVAVLDVGFGVGIGLKALIEQVKITKKANLSISYFSIELDEALLLWSLKNTLPEVNLVRTERVQGDIKLISYEGKWQETQGASIDIAIYLGDGRISLPDAFDLKLICPLDAIFQDAFSPRKNPTLWSVQWFAFLKRLSSDSVKLCTYSSSVSIRKSLFSAGWQIFDAPGFANKKAMTKASLTGKTDEKLILQMARSPSIEISDK